MTEDVFYAAACRKSDVDPELFFPVAARGTMRYELEVGRARDVCGRCPVTTACLRYALEVVDPLNTDGRAHGVMGGMAPEDRDRHRVMDRDRLAERTARLRAIEDAKRADEAAAAVAKLEQARQRRSDVRQHAERDGAVYDDRPRGRCSHCHRRSLLRVDGTMGAHGPCEGVGHTPLLDAAFVAFVNT